MGCGGRRPQPGPCAGLRLSCRGGRGSSGLSLLPHHELLSATAAREDFCPACLLLGKQIVDKLLDPKEGS